MDDKISKIKFIYKGIKERVSESDRKVFNSANVTTEQDREVIYKIPGIRYLLKDSIGTNIGSIYLWDNDPEITDAVKIKLIIIDDYYQGSGAVYALYDKALEIAKELNKDLILDCKAGLAAYKSFQKFANQKNLSIIENVNNIFNEKTNSYEAPDGEWTLKIILNK